MSTLGKFMNDIQMTELILVPKIYKGKYAGGSFWLSFLTYWSYKFNLLTRLTQFYCSFHRHPYWLHYMRQKAIWLYSHMALIWNRFFFKVVCIKLCNDILGRVIVIIFRTALVIHSCTHLIWLILMDTLLWRMYN